jgi:hypothetical protein
MFSCILRSVNAPSHGQGKFLVDFACQTLEREAWTMTRQWLAACKRMKKSTKSLPCLDLQRSFIRPNPRFATGRSVTAPGHVQQNLLTISEEPARSVRAKLHCNSTILVNHALPSIRPKDAPTQYRTQEPPAAIWHAC